MSWSTLPPLVQVAASGALTDKQLAAFKLELSGLSLRKIAQHLLVAPTTAKDRLDRAHTHLLLAGVRQDDLGQWFIAPTTKDALRIELDFEQAIGAALATPPPEESQERKQKKRKRKSGSDPEPMI